MSEHAGVSLRRRREALGVDLARISELTAIPEDYLRALEAGAPQRLPPGPYATAYARAYERVLDRLESGSVASVPSTFGSDGGFGEGASMPNADGEDAGPPSESLVVRSTLPTDAGERGVPVRMLRRVAAGLTGILAVLVAVEVARDGWGWWTRPHDADPVDVQVELRSTATLRVSVDGRLEAAREFAGGEIVGFHGRERVEIDLPDLESARVSFRGHPVLPQGHQDRPRRLVFASDGAVP
jgi:hypothetical protein